MTVTTLRYLEHQLDELHPPTGEALDRAILLAMKSGLCLGLVLASEDAGVREGMRLEASARMVELNAEAKGILEEVKREGLNRSKQSERRIQTFGLKL